MSNATHTPKPVRCAGCGRPIGKKQPRMELTRSVPSGKKTRWGVMHSKCFAQMTGRPEDVIAALRDAEQRPRGELQAEASAA